MRYCPNCNNPVPDGSNFCPTCGAQASGNNNYANGNPYGAGNPYAAGNPYNTDSPYGADPFGNVGPGPSYNYMAVQKFSKKATTIRNLGIAAAILLFGIGFIFSIIIWVMSSGLQEPFVTNPTPFERAELESARKKLKLGKILAFLPVVAFVISFLVGFFGAL